MKSRTCLFYITPVFLYTSIVYPWLLSIPVFISLVIISYSHANQLYSKVKY
jgi:hypothetical protein